MTTNSTALLGKAAEILKFLEPKTLSYCLKKKCQLQRSRNVGVSRNSPCQQECRKESQTIHLVNFKTAKVANAKCAIFSSPRNPCTGAHCAYLRGL